MADPTFQFTKGGRKDECLSFPGTLGPRLPAHTGKVSPCADQA